jgi:hypothetical protein
MAELDYFSHNIPPDGHLVFVEMRAEGYCFRMAGENIGMWNPEKDPEAVEAAFMASPEHRANIQNPAWTVMGYGSATASDGRWYVVVLFALPCAPAPTASPTHAGGSDDTRVPAEEQASPAPSSSGSVTAEPPATPAARPTPPTTSTVQS